MKRNGGTGERKEKLLSIDTTFSFATYKPTPFGQSSSPKMGAHRGVRRGADRPTCAPASMSSVSASAGSALLVLRESCPHFAERARAAHQQPIR